MYIQQVERKMPFNYRQPSMTATRLSFIKDEDQNQWAQMALNDFAGILLANGETEIAISLFEKAAQAGDYKAKQNLQVCRQMAKRQFK